MSNRMELENPYQPPRGDGQEETAPKKKAERPVYDTRWQATRAGFRRGAILGTKVLSIASLCVMSLGVLLFIGMLLFVPELVRPYPGGLLGFARDGALSFLALIFFYGAIPGGIIMGLIETVRFRKSK